MNTGVMPARSFLLALLSIAWSLPAGAEEPAPVVPPVVKSSTDVPYPAEGRGDASVVLELLVDETGRVAAVKVVEGAEPFVEHALRAAQSWRFEPARRSDSTVAARIRARIEFHEEPDGGTGEAVGSTATPDRGPPATSPGTPPANEPAHEVTVLGERREIGKTTLSATEIRRLPGAFGDAFRALEALPGVTPASSGLPYFFVRGAPPNNNGYFLDGVRVPALFHIGLGPAVVHPSLVERVDFYPGAAPARFGGVTGGIIAATTPSPSPRPSGEVSLRLVDAGALVESPLAGERMSALVAGRYGYPGPVVGLFSETELGYWDYQTKVTWRASERQTLGMFAFGSHDYLAHRDDSGVTVEDLVSDFHRVDLRYDERWSDGSLRVAGTLGYDSQGSNPTYLTNRSAELRIELDQELFQGLRLRAGADARLDDYALRREAPAEPDRALVPSNVDPPPTNLTTGAHADVVWRPGSRVELVPGVRVTLFDSTRAGAGGSASARTTVAAVDPRFSSRVLLAKRLTWLSSIGLAHQYPVLRVGELPAPLASGAGFAEGSSRLQRALQMSQGVELGLPERITLGTTAFLSRYWGLTDLTASCLQIEPPSGPPGEGPRPDDPWFCPSNAAVRGHAHGLEVFLRRPFSDRLGGLLSYTLSRSVRETRFLRLDGGVNVATVPSDFDRTHVLNAALGYELGVGWTAGSRFVLYSGAPYSALSGNVPAPPYNTLRDPLFYRLDVRLEKRWRLGEESFIAFVAEGQNVTLSKEANTLGMDCIGDLSPEGYTTECSRGEIGPITIPSLGVEATF